MDHDYIVMLAHTAANETMQYILYLCNVNFVPQ